MKVVLSFFLLPACLFFFALSGCSKPQCSACENQRPGLNSPQGAPTPAAGQAQITYVTPAGIEAASPDFTITVTGVSFTPTTTVMWDDLTSLKTTYVSSTTLRAQVPTSLIDRAGSVSLMPSPLGTFNFGTSFTVAKPTLKGNTSFNITKVSVQANDMVWVPTDSRLYLSVAGGNNTNPNTITALDPKTGQFSPSATTSGEPGKLAVSSDGTYLYTGVNNIFSVRRFSLPSLQASRCLPCSTNRIFL
jgi:hypothetical protein